VAEMHDTTEEYLETIFEIEEEGIVPIRARLVERLRLSAPAVSETVNRLVEQGNVELLDNRRLQLTPKGRAIARSIVRRHRLAERLLVDVIGLEWEKAHREADRWEHAISADVEAKLVLLLGDPATCPHGNPIPGSEYIAPDAQRLADIDVGHPFTVTRIPEELEFAPGLLDFLEESAIQPGRTGMVTASSPDGTITVEIDGRHIGVGTFASSRIFVTA
jgi:DtxR family transcriptional regulator, Mn-dependent transcriptional regulator